MDKSFNDQELSDIMKEIEALEEEFSGDDVNQTVEATAVMEELAEMEVEKSVPATNKKETVLSFEKKATPTPMISMPTNSSTTPTAMSFKVQGDLNLELQFEVGGKCIMLEVSETGMNIKMDGGVSFSVPVTAAQSHKKAV